jgi:uncharacterized membrane protein YukC
VSKGVAHRIGDSKKNVKQTLHLVQSVEGIFSLIRLLFIQTRNELCSHHSTEGDKKPRIESMLKRLNDDPDDKQACSNEEADAPCDLSMLKLAFVASCFFPNNPCEQEEDHDEQENDRAHEHGWHPEFLKGVQKQQRECDKEEGERELTSEEIIFHR